PMAFFSGSAGAIYRQFSVTIIAAMGLSVLVALILSPSLCASILTRGNTGPEEKKTGMFGSFNRGFEGLRETYQTVTNYMVRRAVRFIGIYGLLVGGLLLIFSQLPTAFLPNEDQGYMFMMVNAPPGATAERTLESVKQVEDYFLTLQTENIDHLFTVVGFSFAGSAQNAAFGFIGMKDWKDRPRTDQSVFAVAGQAMQAFSQIKDAMAFAFFPPPIREIGNASGFDFQLIDQGGLGHEALMAARGKLLGMAAQNPKLTGVRPNGLNDVPQYKIAIDTEKAAALGLSLGAINDTLTIAWGSSYINDFLDKGRIKRVYLQANAPYRMMPDDLSHWYVRNEQGEMISFDAFSTSSWTYGSPKLERFNGKGSVNIQGAPAPGISSGEAMTAIEDMVKELPAGIGLAWSGISYEERATGAQAPALYALSLLVVFLCLAALYESWAVPLAVILVVPLGVLGAVLVAYAFGLPNDVYLQVALLTTVGLASKNAILIVEFAKALTEQGHSLAEAAFIAAGRRFRPIVMTSMAFMLGVTPLALSHGAGAAAQNAIGLTVLGGMAGATCLAILFVPLFYVAIAGVFRRGETNAPDKQADS
ncbi:MAG: efflux RND transporter permease subunit, partial [Alphaproteobacteria bacterium]|nr:efflux RND transporter permease subunit [Alphaproteobacteria bacterium]